MTLEDALAQPGKLVAAWDRRSPDREVLAIYLTSDAGAAQIYSEEFSRAERQRVQHRLLGSTARIGAAYSYTGHVWVLDSRGVGVWTNKATLVEGSTRMLGGKSGAIKARAVTKVITFVDPRDIGHRGVNCQLAAGVATFVEERYEAAKSNPFYDDDAFHEDMRWALLLGLDLAMWLRVPHVDHQGHVTNASDLEVAKVADGLADTIEKLPSNGDFDDILEPIGTFGSTGPLQFRCAPRDLTRRVLELHVVTKLGTSTVRRIEQGTNEQLAVFLRDVRTPRAIMLQLDEMAGRPVREVTND